MIRGTVVTIGGKKYLMPPLNINALEKHEAFFKMSLKAVSRAAVFGTEMPPVDRMPDSFSTEQFSDMLDLVYLALKRNYPEITKEELGEALDLADITALIPDMMRTSGFVDSIEEVAEPGKP